jgi:hypothetical protein
VIKHQSLHERRGVSFAELGAVFAVQSMLKAGVLVYEKIDADHAPGAHIINMRRACEPVKHCGSLACIGGTMGLFLGLPTEAAKAYVGGQDEGDDVRRLDLYHLTYGSTLRSPSLRTLFYPPDCYAYDTITKAQMLAAIANWLDTGQLKWRTVLKATQLERNQR